MNHREKLIQIYKRCSTTHNINVGSQQIADFVCLIAEKSSTQKGVYTVLITLLTHKILHPEQDISLHQSGMEGGFSGRTIDTKYITPTLKELGLPSMNESGWLTRSLEQPYPYALDYNGKINDTKVKNAFLNILHWVQHTPQKASAILTLLIKQTIDIQRKNRIVISPLKNPEKLTIERIVHALSEHFTFNYKTHGGSKLPVLAFYAIYQSLVVELKRYESKTLGRLGSHTASDKTSKSAGDIEILSGDNVFEAIEIKLGKEINANILRVAIEKIYRFNPSRYYILSDVGTNQKDADTISRLVSQTQETHGCQLIVNGLIPTLKYYLRLITSLEKFVSDYSRLIESDLELQKIHKQKWNEILHSLHTETP